MTTQQKLREVLEEAKHTAYEPHQDEALDLLLTELTQIIEEDVIGGDEADKDLRVGIDAHNLAMHRNQVRSSQRAKLREGEDA